MNPRNTFRSFAEKQAYSCMPSVPGNPWVCFGFCSLPHSQATFNGPLARYLNLKMTSSGNRNSSKASCVQAVMSLPAVCSAGAP